VRWYALAYIAGLIIGWQIMRRVCQQQPKVLTPQKIDDFLLWAALGVHPRAAAGLRAVLQSPATSWTTRSRS
jgi:prolipoprotein diacylglyceryltransferase